MRPLDVLAAHIGAEAGRPAPPVPADGAGTGARVVVLLGRPAADRDPAWAAVLGMAAVAGVPPQAMLRWGAVPWSPEGDAAAPSEADLRAGARWLRVLLALLPAGARVVALGAPARRCCVHAGLVEGTEWRGGRSPGGQGLNGPPRRGMRPPDGMTWRQVHRAEIVDALRWAGEPPPPPDGPPGLLCWLLGLDRRR